ncbi:MAG TPA: hypothetical protein VF469_28420, partial [Kofleriaceae bacterium]
MLGVAGGMVAVAAGFLAGYFVLDTRSEAHAAVTPAEPLRTVAVKPAEVPSGLAGYLSRPVEVATAHGSITRTWAELGAAIDADETGAARGELAALAGKGSLPLRIDREKATLALLAIKASHDVSPINAYLDLEERKIHDDRPGQGLDVWASLPVLEAAARQGAAKVELVNVAVPAAVTR